MKIRLNKEIEFLFKKILPDKYLLKKRLIRAIKNNYEEELSILDKIVNKDLESVDVGVYRGVYSYKLSKISKHVHSIEPNPLIFPYLERKLKDKCRVDRARIQIGRISNFGLLEMSRQRLRESNVKWNLKLSNETFALKVIKLVELKTLETNAKIVKMYLNDKINNFIKENYYDDFNYFKRKNKIEINLFENKSLGLDDYEIEFLSKTNKVIEKSNPTDPTNARSPPTFKKASRRSFFLIDCQLCNLLFMS